MAFIRIIDNGYGIIAEKTIAEPTNITDELREEMKSYPKAVAVLYWTDNDIKNGYDHPMQILSLEYEKFLQSIGRY